MLIGVTYRLKSGVHRRDVEARDAAHGDAEARLEVEPDPRAVLALAQLELLAADRQQAGLLRRVDRADLERDLQRLRLGAQRVVGAGEAGANDALLDRDAASFAAGLFGRGIALRSARRRSVV